jgi:hypothetical protein
MSKLRLNYDKIKYAPKNARIRNDHALEFWSKKDKAPSKQTAGLRLDSR